MRDDAATDRAILTGEAYPDGRNLDARRSIYAYRDPQIDLPALVLAELPAHTGLVLDVGCGDGTYSRRLRAERPALDVVGVDLSPGMAAATAAAASTPTAVASAEHLPFPDRGAAGVLAPHMLYHVPRPAVAVDELARVVATDGTVLISTNARGDKTATTALWRDAARDVTGVAPTFGDVTERCDLDHAERLARDRFARVRRIDLVGELVVPEAGPVRRFLRSQRSVYGVGLPVEAVLARAGELLADAIGRSGAFRMAVHTGIIVCSGPTTLR